MTFSVYICSLLLLLLSHACLTKDISYKDSGPTAVLKPDPITDPIIEVVYSCNGTLVAIWRENQTICYESFKGRCEINKETGALTINDLTLADCRTYKVKIYTITRKPTINNLSLRDCGNHNMNVNKMRIKNNEEDRGSDTTIIIISIVSVVAVAGLCFLVVYCYKHRTNPDHPTVRIRKRCISWLRPMEGRSSFQDRSRDPAEDPLNSSSSSSEAKDQT